MSALAKAGDEIAIRHRFFDGFSWHEETLYGTLEHVNDTGDYGMCRLVSGGGMDCHLDSNGDWRHGR